MNNNNNLWEGLDWTNHASKLLSGLSQFPKNSKIILLLRHSERNEPKSVWDPQELLLTPVGHQIAKMFGKSLPINRPIRFFTSHAPRCQETAEDIIEGFKGIGGKAELKGNLEPLYNIGVDRTFFITQIENRDLVKYIQNWVMDAFPPDKVQPLSTYSINSAKIIWNLINDGPNSGIDIHVTHEIPIMGLRFGWFNLQTDEKWVNFLGGIAFTFQNGQILLFDIDKFLTVDVPHWWKK